MTDRHSMIQSGYDANKATYAINDLIKFSGNEKLKILEFQTNKTNRKPTDKVVYRVATLLTKPKMPIDLIKFLGNEKIEDIRDSKQIRPTEDRLTKCNVKWLCYKQSYIVHMP